MNRSPMPRRKVPLSRGAGLPRGTGLEGGGAFVRSAPLRAVSAKRTAENRERRKVVAELWPDGRPSCEWPDCPRLADDVHERLPRARGGSITDRENLSALCRSHHDHVTFTPESRLADAYRLGFLVHSWDAPRGGDAA